MINEKYKHDYKNFMLLHKRLILSAFLPKKRDDSNLARSEPELTKILVIFLA
jgi:hypothetical protein